MLIHKGKESIEILAKREGLDILLSSSHSLDTTLLHRCDSVRHSNRLHSLLSISLSVLCITPDSLIHIEKVVKCLSQRHHAPEFHLFVQLMGFLVVV